MKICLVLLCYLPCLFVLGKVLRKTDAKALVHFTETIDIDNPEDGHEINASGDDGISGGGGTDDDDDDDVDVDEDKDEIASGDGIATTTIAAAAAAPPVVLSACQGARKDANGRNLIGVFIPRCTPDGHFEPVQCHGSTGECWCVDKGGSELLGSRRRAEKLKCDRVTAESNAPVFIVPSRRPPGSGVFEEISTSTTNSSTTTTAAASPSTTETNSDDGFILIQSTQESMEPDNRLNQIPNEPSFDVGPPDMDTNNINARILPEPRGYKMPRSSILNEPGILAGIIGGAVVGLLCAVLLVMFIVYHMRKKDSDPVFMIDRPSRSPSKSGYTKAFDKEMYT